MKATKKFCQAYLDQCKVLSLIDRAYKKHRISFNHTEALVKRAGKPRNLSDKESYDSYKRNRKESLEYMRLLKTARSNAQRGLTMLVTGSSMVGHTLIRWNRSRYGKPTLQPVLQAAEAIQKFRAKQKLIKQAAAKHDNECE